MQPLNQLKKTKKKKNKTKAEKEAIPHLCWLLKLLYKQEKKISFLYAEKVTFSHGGSKDFTLRENDQMSSFIQAPEILIYTT